MVPAGVNSVPEHDYGGKVAPHAGVVLHVVEPPRHVHILLLLLDGQVHLGGRHREEEDEPLNGTVGGDI